MRQEEQLLLPLPSINQDFGNGLYIQRMIIAILLDGNHQNIYYAGQTVSGHVRVETNEEIKMRGIRLEVNGYARVHWSEGAGKKRRSYNGHENFIELKTYLTGSDKDSEIILKPGVSTYPLSFALPNTAPSSFEGEGLYGSIKYKLQAIVDRPWKINDSTDIKITVIRWLDLNYEPPQLREPVVVLGERPAVGCCYYCCCIKGLPDIELRINRGCFVPGETIFVNGQVVNNSNTSIEKTEINFIQEFQFCATRGGQIYRRKFQYQTLCSTKRPQIESGSTDTWSDVAFTVPLVVASRLDGCNIINITYFIQVKAHFSRGCADSTIRQDIVIGHLPLQGVDGPITAQPPTYTQALQNENASIPEKQNYSGVKDGADILQT